MTAAPRTLTQRIHDDLISDGKMKSTIRSNRDRLVSNRPDPHTRRNAAHQPWHGDLAKKPWEYRVTAVIPHRNTLEHLKLCLEFVQAQSERPYVMIIDTGSDEATLAGVLALRSDNVEVHQIACHGTEECADVVCYAMDLAMSACRTEYLWCLHSDCFVTNRELLAEMLSTAAGGKQPVIGYESTSANKHAECKGMVSHTCTLLHMPTMHELDVTWSRARLATQSTSARRDVVFDPEMALNYRLRDRGISPLLLGPENAGGIERDANRVHLRSATLAEEIVTTSPTSHAHYDSVLAALREMPKGHITLLGDATCDGQTVAVIVPCHNYGRYLDECISSIAAQSRRPNEIVIVDDGSTDNTPKLASRWTSDGVNYIRVEHRDVRAARLAGFEATRSNIVCFIDADDYVDRDYIRNGLAMFSSHDIGIVYSDMHFIGTESGTFETPNTASPDVEAYRNVIHAGSLVRREALEMSGALYAAVDSRKAHDDWFMWRRVLSHGWRALKQPGLYWYRKHGHNASLSKCERRNYFELFGMEHETFTLFVPLSGRGIIWAAMEQFLELQTWPHDRVRLMMMDTSQDRAFGSRVRSWLAGCDYRDVRYFAESVAQPRLADVERRGDEETCNSVRMAMARIYNRLGREAIGNFILVIEDDVIPPANVAESLLRGFDEHTGTVAAPYRSRYHDGYVAWRDGRQIISERGVSDFEVVSGNGFGCTMFRGNLLREALFTAKQPPYLDFDPAFYARLNTSGLAAKLCWEVECQHLEEGSGPVMVYDRWPARWRDIELDTYRSSFLCGHDACQWIVDTFNGAHPTAILSLGDGDVAWWCYDALARTPDVSRYWLEELASATGLKWHDREKLWPLFDDALRNATAWPCQFGWEVAERFCIAAMTAQGVAIERLGFRYGGEMKQKVDCNAVYRLKEEGLWWSLLRSKQLAVVSNFADDVSRFLRSDAFVRANGGERVDWSIALSVSCPPEGVAKAGHWPRP